MHEISLCEGMRGIIEDQARIHRFSRITVLRLEIGKFAGVERAALEFAFDTVMKGGPAEGARLEMIDLPAFALCYGCGQEGEIDERFSDCPRCGSARLMPHGGDEMRIKNMEVI